ncbi:MAG: methyltransferase domain-containing protein [Elusimicrobiota bacterium]
MTTNSFSRREILVITGVVSFCSLVYEMSIAACFVSLTGDDILWHSLTIGIYLAALGIGAAACPKTKDKETWSLFLRVETALALIGALSVSGILAFETLYRVYFQFIRDFESPASVSWYAATLALCHGWTFVIGFLSGCEIPLMLRAAETAPGRPRAEMNHILGVNYLGALAGTLAFGFILLPLLDVTGPCLAAAALNLAVCVYLLQRRATGGAGKALLQFGAAAAVLTLCVFITRPLYRFSTANFYSDQLGTKGWFLAEKRAGRRPTLGASLRHVAASTSDLQRVRSRYQYIDLLSGMAPTAAETHYNRRLAADPGLPANLVLFLNRRFQLRGASEAFYHEYLTHVPIQMFRSIPKDVLIIGGGDGNIARELLKYGDRVRSITNVELDPEMIRLARSEPRLRRINGGAYDDPKVRVVIADAFSYARGASETFDAIYVDLPYPNNYDVSRVYSVEFFGRLARLLRPDGTLTLDYPMRHWEEGKPAEHYRDNSVIQNTLQAAGFKTVVPYTTRAPELVDAATARKLSLSSPDYDPEINRLLRQVEKKRFLRRYPGYQPPAGTDDLWVLDNAVPPESMLACRRDEKGPRFGFKDHGIKLHFLTAQRLRILWSIRFPHNEDPRLINYVFRPALYRSHNLRYFALL